MFIHHKPASVVYKLIIGILSLTTEWFILISNGPAALRLFPIWVLFISSVYYLSSALFLALSHKRSSGRPPCPVFEGMVIIGFFLMSGTAILSAQHQFYLPPLADWIVWMICLVLPILTLFDWILFDEKGRWHPMAPFYWLALPVCYAATMIFTADILPFGAQMLYPLELLDYTNFGFEAMFDWIFLIAALVLVAGYVLYLLDFISSGKLAKIVVLPHIQVIEVDEDGSVISPDSSITDNVESTKPEHPSHTIADDESTKPKRPSPKPSPAKTAGSTSAPSAKNQNSKPKTSPTKSTTTQTRTNANQAENHRRPQEQTPRRKKQQKKTPDNPA